MRGKVPMKHANRCLIATDIYLGHLRNANAQVYRLLAVGGFGKNRIRGLGRGGVRRIQSVPHVAIQSHFLHQIANVLTRLARQEVQHFCGVFGEKKCHFFHATRFRTIR